MSMPTKAQMRRDVRGRVSALAPEVRRAADTVIVQAVLDLLPDPGARTWCIAAYAAFPSEVQTDALLRTVCDRYGTVALPAYGEDDAPVLAACSDLDALVPGPHEVRVPPPPLTLVDPAGVDVILVPGLAFDQLGVRLGRGAGYYDQLLARVPGRRIGLAYEAQVVPRLPAEPYDAQVDHVVTEAHVYTARAWRFDSYDAPC